MGTVAVVATIYDKNDLKQMAAGFVSRSIDRKLEINGDANVDIGWVTRLRVEDIVLANAPWSKTPTMAQIAVLDVSINLRELLHRHVVLPAVEISKPRIVLEKNAQGEANWQFNRTAKATAESAAPGSAARSRWSSAWRSMAPSSLSRRHHEALDRSRPDAASPPPTTAPTEA